MSERRKSRRIRLIGSDLIVCDRTTGASLGNVLDISRGGLRVESQTELKEGQLLRLKIFLPQSDSEKNSFEVEAICSWSRPGKEADSWETGIQFVDIGSEELALIDALDDEVGMTVSEIRSTD